MGTPVDIEALANEALSLVSQEQEKTASDDSDPVFLQTDIGKALKQAADLVRQSSSEVSNADLQLNKTAGTKKDPTRTIKTMYEDRKKLRKARSKLGAYFHGLSEDVKTQGTALEEQKAVKISHLINAAIGLRHLEGN